MADLQLSGRPMYASFNSGELTPYLWDRVKYERFAAGAETLQNFLCTKHGPIFHRPGTLYVNTMRRSNELEFDEDKKRLKSFVFNRTQVFMLEFGHKYIRFYSYDKNGDPIAVQKNGNIYEIETPYNASDLTEMRFTQSLDTVYITHPLYAPRTLVRNANTDWVLSEFDFQDGPYELENLDKNKTMSVTAKTGTVTLTANFDVFLPDMIGRLVRISHDKKPGWGVIVEYIDERNVQMRVEQDLNGTDAVETWRLGAWYGVEQNKMLTIHATYIDNPEDSDIALELLSGTKANKEAVKFLRASNINNIAQVRNPFTAQDLGRVIRLEVNGQDAYMKITRIGLDTTNAYDVGAYCEVELIRNSIRTTTTKAYNPFSKKNTACTIEPTKTWSISSLDSVIVVGGAEHAHYPAACTFHMERLYFGGGLYTPQTIWGSRPGDFPVFSPTDDEDLITDDMAVTFVLATDELNSITWLKSTDSLYIGTIGPEFKLTAGAGEVITPSIFQFARISDYGSSIIEPQYIGNSIVFSQNSRRTLRELSYEYSTDKYIANDLTLLGEHLAAIGLTSFAYQKEPHSIVWATQDRKAYSTSGYEEGSGGALIGLTYDKEQNVQAWHQHKLGGKDVECEYVATLFNDSIQQDQVWVAVKRTINGERVRTLEVIDKDFRLETPVEDIYFVDCGARYNAYKLDPGDPQYGQPIKDLYHLDWLKGEEVQITIDGATHANKIVDENGHIELDWEGHSIAVGLYAPAIYKSLYLDPGAGGDSYAQGYPQNIVKADIRFYRTTGGKMGPSVDALIPIQYRTPLNLMDKAVPLYTGEKTIQFPANWGSKVQVVVQQDVPLPMTILAILPKTNVVKS